MNITCATCGVAITQLPFVPDGTRPVYCQDCNAQRRRESRDRRPGDGGGSMGARAPRPMQDVSSMGITCAGCGTAITELPFTPDPSRAIYCRNCYKSNRA